MLQLAANWSPGNEWCLKLLLKTQAELNVKSTMQLESTLQPQNAIGTQLISLNCSPVGCRCRSNGPNTLARATLEQLKLNVISGKAIA